MAGGFPSSCLSVSSRVSEALYSGRPVVALETTLVTHGLPQPEGLEVALELEEIVRAGGAVPATIGVLGGRLTVGLTTEELERLAETPEVLKLNPGNLAAGITSGKAGSTTVAASMLAAHRTGIRVLATGGIGGVHRNAAETGDISADLLALSRLPVAVVCAGAKAILDLPRTIEALESLGVPVYGLDTEEFPAFYRRDSGLPIDGSFDSIDNVAAAVRAHFEIAAGTGVVVACPVPAANELPKDLYESALTRAFDDLRQAEIQGRQVTPFLLQRMDELTAGQSTTTNRALLVSNTQAATKLAALLT